MNVLVNEVFETIQGEAGYTGTPAVFVRLQGCTVGCSWCDTKNTWAADNTGGSISELFIRVDQYGGIMVDPTALVEEVTSRYRSRHVVLTGGEPLEQDVRELVRSFLAAGWTVQIETSGTAYQDVDPRVFVTLSPKVGMKGGKVVDPRMLLRASEIKMPVGRQSDIDTLDALLALPRSSSAKVWLQPISCSLSATALCVKTATERRWNVSIQVHKVMNVR
jgi:7-carboxy-7-deazaguanine synthase